MQVFFLLMADIMVNLDRFEKQDLLSGVTHVSVYRKLGGIPIECYKTCQLIKKLKKSLKKLNTLMSESN